MTKLSHSTFENAIIYPLNETWKNNGGFDKAGVYDKDGFRVANYVADKKDGVKCDLSVDFIDTEVIFLGLFGGVYGHFITEEFGRFWWILENDLRGKKFAYTRIGGEFRAFERYILELLGVDDKQLIFVKKPTRFARIILPKRASFWGDDGRLKFSDKQKSFIDFITSKVNPIKNDKIYLSRGKFFKSRMREFGERYFEEIYAKKGYKIIYPETLSPREQLALWGGG